MSRRIGLYGGTFDPVHLGHLIGAQDALEQMHLDEMVFIPCAQSPHKLDRLTVPAKHRLKMLKLALRGQDRFWVSDCELKRGGPSFAIDTVRAFHQGRPKAEFFWLIGQDQVEKLTTWQEFPTLSREVTFLVMDRPGTRRVRAPKGVIYLPQPRLIAISSTEIRLRLKNQLQIDHLVPPSVARYIARENLYQ